MDPAGTAVRSIATPVDDRGPADIGRRARLELRFGVRRGLTTLVHAYAEPPFRVGRPFRDGRHLHLILATSAPGVFGGDLLQQDIVVEDGAAVRLTSQAALQVHPSASAALAGITNRFTVGAGATLVGLWDPVIPFPASMLRQRFEITLAPDARLLWSDAVMAGREARGERWQFTRLEHELSVRRGDHLVYLERYLLEPRRHPVNTRWLAGDASYFGSILAVATDETDRAGLHALCGSLTGVDGAVDQVERDVMLVRLMSVSGANFHAARAALVRRLESNYWKPDV